MAIYNPQITPITGEKIVYKQCTDGKFVNDVNPTITYFEGLVTQFPDGTVFNQNNVSNITVDMSNPTEEFPILNPADNSVIGSALKQQLFLMIYSHYIYEAKLRDEAETLANQPIQNNSIEDAQNIPQEVN